MNAISYIFLVVFLVFAPGCSDRRSRIDAQIRNGEIRADEIVVKAMYRRVRAPCIFQGDLIRMASIHKFTILETLYGHVDFSEIDVHSRSMVGPGYPKKLQEGEIYFLKFRLSDKDRQQAKENEQKNIPSAWIDPMAIEEL